MAAAPIATVFVRACGWPAAAFMVIICDGRALDGRRAESCDICGPGCRLFANDKAQVLLDRAEMAGDVAVLTCIVAATAEWGAPIVRQLLEDQTQWL